MGSVLTIKGKKNKKEQEEDVKNKRNLWVMLEFKGE